MKTATAASAQTSRRPHDCRTWEGGKTRTTERWGPAFGTAGVLQAARRVRPPGNISPLSWTLAALLLLHAIAIPLILHRVAGTPRVETIVGEAERFARRSQMDDSWRPMKAARTYATAEPAGDIYEEIFFRRKLKFQYAPSSLLFIGTLSDRTLNYISWAAVWLTSAISVWLFVSSARRGGSGPLDTYARSDLGIQVLAALGLCLTFYPLLKGYTLGQIQIWVNALAALAMWAWCSERRFVAGACLGIACLIKPPLAPLALLAIFRREWRFAGGMIAIATAGLAVSVAIYGLSSHLSYLRVLSFIAPLGETYYPNQSVNGLLNRWFVNGNILEFDDFAFSPYHPAVAWGTTLTSLLLYLAAIVLPLWRPHRNARVDMAILIVTATIASPIAWEHHYGVTLPLFAMTTPWIIKASPAGRATPWLLGTAFLLIAQYLHVTHQLAFTAWNPLMSYTFIGALLFLVLLYGSVRRVP